MIEQLDRAGADKVQAIVQLRDSKHPDDTPTPEESVKLADTVLQRVAKQVGHAATRSNVLRNLATVVVEADSDFVRSLIGQPEVISAIPNQTADSPFIPPKRKRPV